MMPRHVVAIALATFLSSGCFDGSFFGAPASCSTSEDCGAEEQCTIRSRRCVRADAVAPNAPGDVRVVEITETTVTLSFIAPGDDAGVGLLEAIEATVEPEGGTAFVVPSAEQPRGPGERDELTVTGLTPATRYRVTVRALDDVGNESVSTPIAVATAGELSCVDDAACAVRPGSFCRRAVCVDAAAPGPCQVDDDCPGALRCASRRQTCVEDDVVAPSAPAALELIAASETRVVVGFVAAGDDGGLGTVDLVSAEVEQGGSVVRVVESPGTPRAAGDDDEITISGLTPATRYRVVVIATDEVGNSTRSEPLDLATAGDLVCVVDAECAARPGTTCRRGLCSADDEPPAPPTFFAQDLAVTTTTTATIRFRGTTSLDVLSYELDLIDIETGDTSSRDLSLDPFAQDHVVVIDELTMGHAYAAALRAVDRAGNQSAAATATLEVGGFFCRDDPARVAAVAALTVTTTADLLGLIGCTTMPSDLEIDDRSCTVSLQPLAALEHVRDLTYRGGGVSCRAGRTALASLAQLRVAEDVTLVDLPAVELVFPSLTEMKTLTVLGSASLTRIELSALTSVEEILMRGSLHLRSFAAPALIEADLSIPDSERLTSVELPQWEAGRLSAQSSRLTALNLPSWRGEPRPAELGVAATVDVVSADAVHVPQQLAGGITLRDPPDVIDDVVLGRGGVFRGPRRVERLTLGLDGPCVGQFLALVGLAEVGTLRIPIGSDVACLNAGVLDVVDVQDFDASLENADVAFPHVSGSVHFDGEPREVLLGLFFNGPLPTVGGAAAIGGSIRAFAPGGSNEFSYRWVRGVGPFGPAGSKVCVVGTLQGLFFPEGFIGQAGTTCVDAIAPDTPNPPNFDAILGPSDELDIPAGVSLAGQRRPLVVP